MGRSDQQEVLGFSTVAQLMAIHVRTAKHHFLDRRKASLARYPTRLAVRQELGKIQRCKFRSLCHGGGVDAFASDDEVGEGQTALLFN